MDHRPRRPPECRPGSPAAGRLRSCQRSSWRCGPPLKGSGNRFPRPRDGVDPPINPPDEVIFRISVGLACILPPRSTAGATTGSAISPRYPLVPRSMDGMGVTMSRGRRPPSSSMASMVAAALNPWRHFLSDVQGHDLSVAGTDFGSNLSPVPLWSAGTFDMPSRSRRPRGAMIGNRNDPETRLRLRLQLVKNHVHDSLRGQRFAAGRGVQVKISRGDHAFP
jgi:hypothetical protein